MSTIRANSITNSAGTGAPDFPNGLTDNGVAVATTADIAAIATGPTLGTAVASTSGTAIDFTGIPSTAKRVTVMLSGVSFASSPFYLSLNLGTSSGIDTTFTYTCGYGAVLTSTATGGTFTTGDYFSLTANTSPDPSRVFSGRAVLSNLSGNLWVIDGLIVIPGNAMHMSAGHKSLSGNLDRVRISALGAAFDAGTINISWE